VITSLMIGRGGVVEEGDSEITEMDLSAISEAMNQMIGSASTSLSSLIQEKIDIDTPVAFIMDFNTHDKLENLPFSGEYAVCVRFRMQIGDLIDSEIMQLVPMEFAQSLTEKMKSFITEPIVQPTPSVSARETSAAPEKVEENMATGSSTHAQVNMRSQTQSASPAHHTPVAANAVQFQNFDVSDIMQQKENIEIIMDVPLEVTVELGRTAKKIREILEFSPGSIIELNKLAGEPIDILVNGKFVANGEVVVIDENFGIRVTSIINAEYRI